MLHLKCQCFQHRQSSLSSHTIIALCGLPSGGDVLRCNVGRASMLLTGRDLRAIFALLRKNSSGRVPAHAVLLLRSLAVMAHHQGPTTFFDFANEGAGIVRNTPLRFPGTLFSSVICT